MGSVHVGVAVDQFFQVGRRGQPVLAFHADQGEGQAQVVILGELLHQAGEFGAGVVHALLLDQQAGVGQAQAFLVGMQANAVFQ